MRRTETVFRCDACGREESETILELAPSLCEEISSEKRLYRKGWEEIEIEHTGGDGTNCMIGRQKYCFCPVCLVQKGARGCAETIVRLALDRISGQEGEK